MPRRNDAYKRYLERRAAYGFSLPSFGNWFAWQLYYKHVRRGAKHAPHCFILNSSPSWRL